MFFSGGGMSDVFDARWWERLFSPGLRGQQMRPAGFLLRPLDMELSLPHRLRRFLEHNLTQTTKAANGGVAMIAPCRPSNAK